MKMTEWKQKGVVSLWSYEGNPRHFPGWHLNCDEEGANSLVELVQALTASGVGAARTIKLSAPTKKQLSVPNCREKYKSSEKMVLNLSKKWVVVNADEKLIIEFPTEMANQLITGITGIAAGIGDYSIGSEGSKLWFWW